jgi:hypothetical protein
MLGQILQDHWGIAHWGIKGIVSACQNFWNMGISRDTL